MTATPGGAPRPAGWVRWLRAPAGRVVLGLLYLLLGASQLVRAAEGGRTAGVVFGPMLLLVGVLWLLRPAPRLRDGVVQVPARVVGRTRLPVTDIEAFALPHPFDTTTTPSAVLRSGARVLLREVTHDQVRDWSQASGVPVVRDPRPAVTR